MIHLRKTKIMCNKDVNMDDVILDGKEIDEVDRYVSRADGDWNSIPGTRNKENKSDRD